MEESKNLAFGENLVSRFARNKNLAFGENLVSRLAQNKNLGLGSENLVSRFARNSIFVDSNVFIGIFNKDDALHEKSVTLWNSLKRERSRVIVSNFVISEALTVLSQRVGKETALHFAMSMYFNERQEVEIIYSDERIEVRALDYLKNIPSKNVSFVDATIFAILEFYEIKKLASFDKIFRRQRNIEIYP